MNHPFRDEAQSTLRRYLQKPEDPITMPNQLMAAMTSLPRKGLCSAAQGLPGPAGQPREPLQGSRSDLSIPQGSPTFVGQPWSALRNAFSVVFATGRGSVVARCADTYGRIPTCTTPGCRTAHSNRKT